MRLGKRRKKFKMKYVNCPLCSSNKFYFLFKVRKKEIESTVVKCRKCGMVYLNPVIELPLITPYHGCYTKPDENNFKKFELIYLDKLKKIEKKTGIGRILDVGCGMGPLLSAAKKRGWDVYGVEPDKSGAKEAKKKGFNVFNGILKKANFRHNYFDVITMIEVIEHINRPVNELKGIKKILKKNGLLIIQTANNDSIEAKIKGKNWKYYYFDHKCYFSRKTIRKALKTTGFKIIKEILDDISWFVRMKSIIKYEKKVLRNLLKWNIIYLARILFINKPVLGSMTIYARKI